LSSPIEDIADDNAEPMKKPFATLRSQMQRDEKDPTD
jgi:hypothetical protein